MDLLGGVDVATSKEEAGTARKKVAVKDAEVRAKQRDDIGVIDLFDVA